MEKKLLSRKKNLGIMLSNLKSGRTDIGTMILQEYMASNTRMMNKMNKSMIMMILTEKQMLKNFKKSIIRIR